MSLSKLYSTESLADVIKVELDVNDDNTVASISLARISKNNKSYQMALEKAIAPHRRSIELGAMKESLAEKIYLDVFSEHIVKGFENIPKSDITGNQSDEGYAEYSTENVKELLTRLPELYDMLKAKASSLAEFRVEAQEADAKN